MKSTPLTKKGPGLLITVSLLLTLFYVQVSSVSGQTDLKIENERGFIDSNGFYHIFGEVINKGVKNYSGIKLKIEFYNNSGEVIHEAQAQSSLEILLSGRRSPFAYHLLDTNLAKKVKNYKIYISGFSVLDEEISTKLKIPYHSPNLNSTSEAICGFVQNNGNKEAKFVVIYATYYFANKSVVATSSYLITGLDPGVPQPFTLDFPYSSNFNLSDVKYYALTAECSYPKYAIEDEVVFAFFTPENPYTDPIVLTFIIVITISALMLIIAFLITKVSKKGRRKKPRKSIKPKISKGRQDQ